MTMITCSPALPQPRTFPSRLTLVAAVELILIAIWLRVSDTPAFYPAAIACSLCSVQLGILLINRFSVNTRIIRGLARKAEYSAQPTFITDPAGRFKWVNPRFTRLTGYPVSEIAGKTFGMVLHGQETNTRAVEKIRERMRQALPFESEILEYDRAGNTLWVSTKGQPVLDPRGLLTHYLITQTDVTAEREQSQQIIDALTKPTAREIEAASNTQRVGELTRKLETLAGADERGQLESAVQQLKTSIENCVAVVPVGKDSAQNPTTTSPSAKQSRNE
jgi:PAS domain S-box-containing protein